MLIPFLFLVLGGLVFFWFWRERHPETLYYQPNPYNDTDDDEY